MRLLWLSGAFALGAWAGSDTGGGLELPLVVSAIWAAGALSLVARQWITRTSSAPAFILLLFLLGVTRISVGVPDAQSEGPGALAVAGQVDIEATLLAEPRPYGDSTRLTLTVSGIHDPSAGFAEFQESVKVDVLADRLFGGREGLRGFRYGDRYRITGSFLPKSGGSGYPPGISHDAVGVITSGSVRLIDASAGNPVRRHVADLRGGAAASILRTVGGDAAGLAAAVTTGDRGHLSAGTKGEFRDAGLSHLLAISGLHVAIVAGLGFAAAVKVFGRRHQLYLLAPFAAAWLYASMAGMSPSVVRAGVMASVYLLAIALGRQRSVVPAIAFAAATMILFQPETVVSLSFQMSFAAVLGIAILEPRLRRPMDSAVGWIAPERSPVKAPIQAISRGFGYSLAATAATLPLVGSTFDQVPVFGAVATVLALPAVPLLIVTSLLITIVEPLWTVGATPIGWVAWLSAEWVILVSRAFSGIPGASISTDGWSAWLFLGWYGVLLTLINRNSIGRVFAAILGGGRCWWGAQPTLRLPTWRAASWLAVPVLAVSALPWIAVAQLPDDRLSVTFFETDRGDMILVETPSAKQVLIDGGRDADGALRALGESLPFWDRRIDLVVLTHSDADHVGGLINVLDRYKVGAVVDTVGRADTDVFTEWRDRLMNTDNPVVTATAGMVINLGSGIQLDVIWAGADDLAESNSDSTVLMLRYGDVRMLLTGDIPRSVESRLVDSGVPLDAHVLKAAHHGSNTSSSPNFLRAVAPSLIVVPVGDRTPFSHPDEEVLDRFALHAPGVPVLITKDNGNVVVESDGERLWVQTDR